MEAVIFHLLADLIVLIHFTFVLFVILGGLLAFRSRRWMFIHLPAALWGVVVELGGYICPLTPLEIFLRIKGGGEGYSTGFVANYILPILYPEDLTRQVQIVLGLVVLLINIIAYGTLYAYWQKRKPFTSG